ncbi:MAG: PASTA domain-containing protein [Erysipelotrichaceae bacterium]|nr:PASTA domain-containing protein [Erysipelotrichaceae bacterium]
MRDKRTLILYILAGITTLAIITLAALSFFFLKADVVVVDFSEKTITEIDQWAIENKIDIDYDYQFDEIVEKGMVISQSVSPQTKIKKSEKLFILISLGPNPELEITLPDFTGYSYLQIVEFVDTNKLSDVTYEYVENDKIETDIFISHNISTPTMKRNDMIIFTLSLGQNNEQKEIIVPDFSTYSRIQITSWGSVNNIIIRFESSTSTTIEKGGFIKQSPVAGAITYERRTITVTYSSGLPIQAIDLSGKTKIQVIQWLDQNDNRVNATFIDKYDNNVSKNIVISNRPNSGYLADGATITVNLSLGKPNLPDYSNQNHSLIVTKVNELNKDGASITLRSTTDYSETIDKGKIITQDISGDINVGSTVNVVYSLGKRITLVSQVGKTLSEFRSYLTTNKLLEGVKTERYHDTFSNNTIISHTPAANAIVDEGTRIDYQLSLGVYTPENFVGKTYTYTSNAINAANAKSAGWTLVKQEDYNNSYASGVVYEQSIDSRTLTVKVSRGSSVTIDDYTTKNIGELPSITGVTFVLVAGDYDSNPNGYITSQSVAAGTYPSPLSVTITYSRGAYPTANIPAYMSIYDKIGDPNERANYIRNELTSLGFTNFQVNIITNVSEITSPGVVWHQSQKGIKRLDVEIVINIEPY